MSSLDDLMDVGEPGFTTPARQFASGWRAVARIVVVAVSGSLVLHFALRAVFGRTVPYLLIGVGLVALQVLIAVLVWVRSPNLPETLRFGLTAAKPFGPGEQRDGLAAATWRWARELSWFGLQGGDGEQFARTLQPRLARVAQERLRLRHGITVDSDPARARQLLGKQLWALVTKRARRCPNRRELVALVKQMEEL